MAFLNPRLLDYLGQLGLGLMQANQPGADPFTAIGQGFGFANQAGKEAAVQKRLEEMFGLQKQQAQLQIEAAKKEAERNADWTRRVGLMSQGGIAEVPGPFGQMGTMTTPSEFESLGINKNALGLMADPVFGQHVLGAVLSREPKQTLAEKVEEERALLGLKPPTSRTRNEGGVEITEQFNDATRQWEKIGSGPRWAPQQPDYTLVEIDDPTSPTGVRLVPRREAAGKAAPGKEKAGAAREVQIQDTMATRGVDRATAINAVDGLVKITVPDTNGFVSVIDSVTNKVIKTINPELERADRDRAPAVAAVEQSRPTQSYEDLAEKASGGPSQIGRVLSGAWGFVGGRGEVAPESQDAIRRVGIANTSVRAIMAQALQDGRVSVQALEFINANLVDPTGAAITPESARKQAKIVREFAIQTRDRARRTSTDPGIGSSARMKAREEMLTMQDVLEALGPGAGNVIYAGSADEIARLPKGTRFKAIAEDGLWHWAVRQ